MNLVTRLAYGGIDSYSPQFTQDEHGFMSEPALIRL